MRHPTEETYRRALAEAIKRTRHDFAHGAIVGVRHRSTATDLQQLYVANGRQLRVLAEGNGADASDIGKFWFVVGYSEVGGDDIVPLV